VPTGFPAACLAASFAALFCQRCCFLISLSEYPLAARSSAKVGSSTNSSVTSTISGITGAETSVGQPCACMKLFLASSSEGILLVKISGNSVEVSVGKSAPFFNP
jgi:hypothetical protein